MEVTREETHLSNKCTSIQDTSFDFLFDRTIYCGSQQLLALTKFGMSGGKPVLDIALPGKNNIIDDLLRQWYQVCAELCRVPIIRQTECSKRSFGGRLFRREMTREINVIAIGLVLEP